MTLTLTAAAARLPSRACSLRPFRRSTAGACLRSSDLREFPAPPFGRNPAVPAAGLEEHGTTLVMVTHDHDLARRADRRLYMVDGKFVKEERPAQAQ